VSFSVSAESRRTPSTINRVVARPEVYRIHFVRNFLPKPLPSQSTVWLNVSRPFLIRFFGLRTTGAKKIRSYYREKTYPKSKIQKIPQTLPNRSLATSPFTIQLTFNE